MCEKTPLLLKDFVKEINSSEEKVNKICIIKNNQKNVEYIWNDKKVQNMHSIAKTIISLAIGFAVEEKMLSLDDTLSTLFPEYVNAINSRELSNLSLHNLLSLSIGQSQAYLMMGQRDSMIQDDWIKFSLNQSFDFPPGERFKYSNVGPYLAGVALEKAAGDRLPQFLEKRLFQPLGIELKGWEEDPQGHSFGAGGILIAPEALEKLTSLLLNGGFYGRKKILPIGWINTISTPRIAVEKDDLFSTHYGYGLWIDERTKSFRMDGAYGQLGIVYHLKKAAIVVNSTDAANHILIEKINRLIYPQL